MYANLSAEMARNKITQIDLAKLLNISTSTLSEKMNGKKDFKLSECKKIAKEAFENCSIDYLFSEKNSQQITSLNSN